MNTPDVEESNEPNDRITRIIDRLHRALENDPEYKDDKSIIFLTSTVDKRAGGGYFGYEDTKEAMAALLHHFRVVMQSVGADVHVVTMSKN